MREPGSDLEEHITTERFERESEGCWRRAKAGYDRADCWLGRISLYRPTAGLIKPTTWTDKVSHVDSFTEGFVPARKLTTANFYVSSGSVNFAMKFIPR